jgi:hypothetical protein
MFNTQKRIKELEERIEEIENYVRNYRTIAQLFENIGLIKNFGDGEYTVYSIDYEKASILRTMIETEETRLQKIEKQTQNYRQSLIENKGKK